MDEGIIFREKERKLYISRIPKETKELFIKLAEDQFTGDYGMLLKFLLDQALEYQSFKNIFFNEQLVSDFVEYLNSKQPNTYNNPQEITLLSGKKIQKGGIK